MYKYCENLKAKRGGARILIKETSIKVVEICTCSVLEKAWLIQDSFCSISWMKLISDLSKA